jgi:hypothetical protein
MKRSGNHWALGTVHQNKHNNKQTKENSMKQTTKRILFIVLTVVFLLAACAPAKVATPNPAEIANQVATSVALTVASQNLDTQQAAPVVTDTPIPTATAAIVDTPTAILPTASPFVITPPTTVPSGGGGGGGSTTSSSGYSCDIIHQRPFDYTVFKPGDHFDIKWTILNNGTRTLRAGLDLKYNSGTQMTTGTRELPELAPGDQFDVNFDAVAPEREGTYIMTYIVEGGVCFPYVAIKVEKP